VCQADGDHTDGLPLCPGMTPLTYFLELMSSAFSYRPPPQLFSVGGGDKTPPTPAPARLSPFFFWGGGGKRARGPGRGGVPSPPRQGSFCDPARHYWPQVAFGCRLALVEAFHWARLLCAQARGKDWQRDSSKRSDWDENCA